jgi:polyisoprenoid-binding protein YceI
MKNIIFLILLHSTIVGYSQNLYKATEGDISFFSKTPMENIDAVNKDVKALINTAKGEVAFIVANISFHFKKPLMEEHFNENYMESDKYKTSVFKGKIIGNVDYTIDGEYPVKVKGVLNMHGVEKEREIDGFITVKDGRFNVESEFNVVLKDHKIKIPKLVIKNIAKSVKVSVNLNFELKK